MLIETGDLKFYLLPIILNTITNNLHITTNKNYKYRHCLEKNKNLAKIATVPISVPS